MYVFKLVKSYKKEFIFVVLASIVSLICNLASAYISKELINAAVGKTNFNLWVIVVTIIIISVTKPFGTYLVNKSSYNFAKSFMIDYRKSIIDSYVLNEGEMLSSDFLNTVNQTTTKLKDMFVMPFLKNIRYAILFIGASIYLLYINKIIFLIIVVCSVLPLIIPQIFNKKNQKLRMDSIGENEQFIAKSKEITDGFETIKSFGIEDKIINLFEKLNKTNQKKLFLANRFNVFHMAFSIFISMLGIVSALVTATYLSSKGLITAGEIGAIIQLSNYIVDPVTTIPANVISIKSVEMEMKRIDKMIAKKNADSKVREKFKLDNQISIKNLSFKYGDNEVLKGISLDLEKGKKYAIVGESGSGKSTLANILLRRLDYENGSVKFDDTELKRIDEDDFYSNISLVSQNVFLFNDTLKNNVCLYNDYSQSDFERSIEKSKLNSVIEDLEEKENTVLGEYGTSLSGGEKQRVSISRALIKNSSFVIMDEATSSLDIKTARAIENTLLSLNQTVLVITHRIDESILKKYDKIFLLEDGRITQSGDYSDISYFNEVLS
ncbi:MAG: ABC transporter ATP-binding protein [Finegoldia magna]|uniref:ABC transporter ATP-binding protein n=1 Tax=Finegoldia magna TaxID=1260 RepID=UPI0001DE4AD6|nr:ABC transporter ATP-binding protein [Finegoldia magna]EFK93781.1 ABC transporter, ATP-binding protein [Finegoldia magna ACS-171-V-Col3]MDU2383678.1 ABC transporter ATP-binding protein [Finegoldia magna]MDU7331141.1 ABC transporter ATP-binding protein [Finegoldia magna]